MPRNQSNIYRKTNQWVRNNVFCDKGKSFRESFAFFVKSSHFREKYFFRRKFCICLFRKISLESVLRKNAKMSRNNKCENLWENKMQKFCEKKYGRERFVAQLIVTIKLMVFAELFFSQKQL